MSKHKQKLKKNSNSNNPKQFYSSDPFNEERKRVFSLRQIKHNYATLPQNAENRLHHSKTSIIKNFTTPLRQKISIDVSARMAINQFDSHKINRLNQIEGEIEKINQQNMLRLKELQNIEKTFLKKVEVETKKDRELQVKWMNQYQKLVKQDYQIKLTKQVKKLKDMEDWIVIEKQQQNIQQIARAFEKRQMRMGSNKSLEQRLVKKKIENAQQVGHTKLKSLKKQRKKQNIEELKEMGRQFLEHAKKVQADKVKSNVKIMDVYRKNIDYLPEIKSIIHINAQNLSKPVDQNQSSYKPRRRQNASVKVTI